MLLKVNALLPVRVKSCTVIASFKPSLPISKFNVPPSDIALPVRSSVDAAAAVKPRVPPAPTVMPLVVGIPAAVPSNCNLPPETSVGPT